MLSYFPKIYPDEVLYSYFARYHDHSKNGSCKQTMYELFGKVSAVAVVDLPGSLNEFHNNILHFNPPPLNEFINSHTLFNYYTFFQSTTIKATVLDYLKTGSKPGVIHLLLGIAASVIKDWMYLRFCPSCIKEDRKNFGEAYWHISHQLPKVYYCTIHQELLHNSNIKLRNPNKHEFISAEAAILSSLHLIDVFSPKTKQHLIKLSKESVSLLNKINEIEIEELVAIYKYLLQVNGYANHFGKVNQQYFTQRFKNYYGTEFLKQVDCDYEEFSDTSWVRSIVRKHRKAFHPIQHLLLLNFFNVSIEELDDFKGKRYQPFGSSPFYCLNPAANHFKQRVIETVNITTCTDTRRPVGTFSCSCGFIYSRRGPDLNEDDKFKIGRIKTYGDTWLSKLKQLALNNYSYYQIAHILKCDYATVKKYVEINESDNPLNIHVASLTGSEKEFEWQELIKKYPNYTITQLRKVAPALYAWHYRNNKE